MLEAAHWQAEGEVPSAAARAMAELCRTYWYPLYAYVRRCGHDAPEAEDLTQEFFARLLAKDALAHVSRNKGKFRSFLLASLKHFLANQWDRSQALKRGGGRAILSLDTRAAETRYGLEPTHDLTPEKIYDRQWAMTLLNQVLQQLQAEFAALGEQNVFDELKGVFGAADPQEGYARIGTRLNMSEGAAKVAVHRLRRRYRKLLRERIAQTVAGPDEIDEEIRQLFSAFER